MDIPARVFKAWIKYGSMAYIRIERFTKPLQCGIIAVIDFFEDMWYNMSRVKWLGGDTMRHKKWTIWRCFLVELKDWFDVLVEGLEKGKDPFDY